MAQPVIYGPAYSTFTRSVRITLQEKGIDYKLVEVDFLQGMPEEQVKRHPFSKVPAFEHDGLALYEAAAICRYVDDAFDGPALTPESAAGRARMAQLLSVIDSYVYGPTIGTLFIQRAVMPMVGGTSDEDAIKEALPKVEKAWGVLEGFLEGNDYLGSGTMTIADLHLAPVCAYLNMVPEGAPILDKLANVKRWWGTMSERQSVKDTQPALG